MNQQIYSSTPEQIRSYLEEIKSSDIENKQDVVLMTLLEYLTRKKHQWSIHLEKLLYEFFDQSFNLKKHYLNKEILKAYRIVTQNQYAESLRDVLEYYRDKKLDVILKEEVEKRPLKEIREIDDIESEESPEDLLISSFKLEEKKVRDELKNNMRIVWDGYKSILETVKTNQKLEAFYVETLQQLFVFADKYNRKHEFKRLCDTLRSGLQHLFTKNRIFHNESQRAATLDIENKDINESQVLSRLNQFEVAVKLNLWQESFQILEDVNHLFKVRKGAIIKSTQARYFENLALLFKKSGYWNYHAFAYYNYFITYRRNPKITSEVVTKITDHLLLSVLCIPPFSIEKHQSEESQSKICSLVTSTNKIPDKNELYKLIVEKAIIEGASQHIRELWTFLFQEFNVLQINQKMPPLLKRIEETTPEFFTLVEDIIIYRELIEISKIYKKVKLAKILKLIPFKSEKILSILLSTREQHVLQFQFDEINSLVVFKQNEVETDTWSELQNFAREIAVLSEKVQKPETNFLLKKATDFIARRDVYYNKERAQKISAFKEQLKKPMKEMRKEEQLREQEEKRQREEEERLQTIRQAEMRAKEAERRQQLASKKVIVKNIIKIKGGRLIRINGKKIENLEDQDLDEVTLDNLKEYEKETEKKNKNDIENKFKKAFTRADYIQRERREKVATVLQSTWETSEVELAQILKTAKEEHENRQKKKELLKAARVYVEEELEKEREQLRQKYAADLAEYKKKIALEYKDKILARARELKEAAEKEKAERAAAAKAQEEARIKNMEANAASEGNWRAVGKKIETTTPASQPQPINEIKRAERVETKPQPTGAEQFMWRKKGAQVPATSASTTVTSQIPAIKTQTKTDGFRRAPEAPQKPTTITTNNEGDNWRTNKAPQAPTTSTASTGQNPLLKAKEKEEKADAFAFRKPAGQAQGPGRRF